MYATIEGFMILMISIIMQIGSTILKNFFFHTILVQKYLYARLKLGGEAYYWTKIVNYVQIGVYCYVFFVVNMLNTFQIMYQNRVCFHVSIT